MSRCGISNSQAASLHTGFRNCYLPFFLFAHCSDFHLHSLSFLFCSPRGSSDPVLSLTPFVSLPFPGAPDFKRTPAGERGPLTPALLKRYQAEIDALTTRAKASDAAFLAVFRPLVAAPDPRRVLGLARAGLGAAADAEALGAENAALRRDLEEVADQSVTVRRLEREAAEARAEAEQARLWVVAPRLFGFGGRDWVVFALFCFVFFCLFACFFFVRFASPKSFMVTL
jgi:hypothetical protein